MNLQIIYLSVFATFVQVIEKYLFGDTEFLKWLIVLLVLDTVTGMVYAWRQKIFSSFGFSKVLIKVLIYSVALIVVNVLQNFTIGGEAVAVFAWLDYFLLTAMVLREAISVFENIAKIEPGILPKWIILHLKAFEENIEKKAAIAAHEERTDTK